MEKAKINIEVLRLGDELIIKSNVEGRTYLALEGLVGAIRDLESKAPADAKMLFRTTVLEMLNEKD